MINCVLLKHLIVIPSPQITTRIFFPVLTIISFWDYNAGITTLGLQHWDYNTGINANTTAKKSIVIACEISN